MSESAPVSGSVSAEHPEYLIGAALVAGVLAKVVKRLAA
jgi:hypothetical protein